MGFRLFDFSGDVGVEGVAQTPEQALVELGRGLASVLTDGSPIRPTIVREISLEPGPDWTATAVAFLNELIYLFDTDHFLTSDGQLRLIIDAHGRRRISGTLRGEAYEKGRHKAGRGVKAATFHEALYSQTGQRHRFHVVLDL